MSKAPALTDKQTRFVAEYLVDSNGTQAAIRAGYSESGARVTAHRLLTNVAIHGAIQARQAADATRLSIQREDVLKGLLQAVDQAREQSNPMAMIRGWSEIAKLMGLAAPERVKVDVNVAGSLEMGRLNQLSDAELLKIIEAGAISVT